MQLPSRADTVVVGAGLAGLAAAIHLQRAGRDVVVIDAADAPGGRIRTDVVDGFRLDRGFQLYNPAYPEGARMFDHAALDLRGFTRGAIIAAKGKRYRVADPRAHPAWAIDALRAPLGGPLPLARFAAYAGTCAVTDPRALEQRPDESTADALAPAGAPLTEHLLRPFLAGVFLERDLATSRRFADLILRSFARGTPSVPSHGMERLPAQLAAKVPALHLGVTATDVAPGRVVTDQGAISATSVVVAVDPTRVRDLLPALPAVPTNSCTTWYHVPDQPPSELSFGLPILTIDGDGDGPVVNSAVMTHAAPEYAPPGASLVASTAVGLADGVVEELVRAQLARMHGVATDRWQCLAVRHVPGALPAMLPPLEVRRPVDLGDGIYVAGDHRDTASIQGALVSGRRAAAAVLGVRPGEIVTA